MDKKALIDGVIGQLAAELATQTEAALTSRDEATNEESRSEGKYDMRSQSAAYLAAGQARHAGEIAGAISAWKALSIRKFGAGEAIAVGAVVTLEGGGGRLNYLFGPSSGGMETGAEDGKATVVTAASPLGRQLLGRRVGDSVILPGRAGPLAYRVTAVA